MSTIRRIAKNNLALLIAQIVNISASLVIASLLARFLLPEGYGKYNFVLSLISVFVIFIDFGLCTLLIREVSRDKSKLKKYFNNTLAFYLIPSVFIFLAVIFSVNYFKYPADIKTVAYIIGLSSILGVFSNLFISAFRAFEKMGYEAFLGILERVLLTILIIFSLFYGYGLIGISLSLLFASTIKLLFSFFIYNKKFEKISLEFDIKLWKNLLVSGASFAFVGIFTLLCLKIDTLMLSSYQGNAAVGLYNAAYNPVLFLAFIPSIFLASIFPVLSSKFNSKKNFEKVYNLSFRYLFLILLPLIMGLILLSEKIILLLFGESYIYSIYLVKILAFAQIFSFMAWLLGFALSSINKQKLFMIATGIGLIINITLNLLFIPSIGAYGAAFSILITHISVFFLLLYFSSKHIGKLNLLKLTIKPIIASAMMAGIIACLYQLSLIILIPLGGAVYFILLYLIKGFSEEDKEILSSIIKPKK